MRERTRAHRNTQFARFPVHVHSDRVGHLLAIRPEVGVESDPAVTLLPDEALDLRGSGAGAPGGIGEKHPNEVLRVRFQD